MATKALQVLIENHSVGTLMDVKMGWELQTYAQK
jgi:hypothetical protein